MSERTGLKFIPLFTPLRTPVSKRHKIIPLRDDSPQSMRIEDIIDSDDPSPSSRELNQCCLDIRIVISAT